MHKITKKSKHEKNSNHSFSYIHVRSVEDTCFS